MPSKTYLEPEVQMSKQNPNEPERADFQFYTCNKPAGGWDA